MSADIDDIPVVILAGGLGTRLREETEFKPKPMVEVGKRPMIWHIMRHYSRFGYKKFIVCLGYKGEVIINYFMNHHASGAATVTKIGGNRLALKFLEPENDLWDIFLCDTGEDSLTGDRLMQIANHIDTPYFLMTYGDGLSNVNIDSVVAFHLRNRSLATLTAVHPANRFGTLEITESGMVNDFLEKPQSRDWINGGFFVLNTQVFDEIQSGSFEEKTLPRLARDNKLSAFKHDGFWQCMDTYREYLDLNRMWNTGNAPWLEV